MWRRGAIYWINNNNNCDCKSCFENSFESFPHHSSHTHTTTRSFAMSSSYWLCRGRQLKTVYRRATFCAQNYSIRQIIGKYFCRKRKIKLVPQRSKIAFQSHERVVHKEFRFSSGQLHKVIFASEFIRGGIDVSGRGWQGRRSNSRAFILFKSRAHTYTLRVETRLLRFFRRRICTHTHTKQHPTTPYTYT